MTFLTKVQRTAILNSQYVSVRCTFQSTFVWLSYKYFAALLLSRFVFHRF